MIKFKRRKLQCWVGTEGYVDYHQSDVSDLLFNSEQELLDWIKITIKLTPKPFNLVIEGKSVIWGGVIGWIEEYEVMDIAAEKAKIDRERAELDERLRFLQYEVCKHPNAVKTSHSNAGNWCPQDDQYWYEFRCPDCGLFWMEDQ